MASDETARRDAGVLRPSKYEAAVHIGWGIFRSRGFGAFAGWILLAGVFQGLSGRFFTGGELRGMSLVASEVGTIGVGVSFLMIAGEFDLSVGAMFAFVPIVLGELIAAQWNVWIAFVLVLAMAAAVGVVHGLITTRLGIPSFITTLATLFVLTGLSFLITSGLPVGYFQQTAFRSLLGGNLGNAALAAPFVWMFVFGVTFWFIHGFTQYGNWTTAAGARGGAARALGVPVATVKTINFALCAMLAGFAGCAAFAQLGSVDASFGTDANLLAIVAAVLGGTSLFGVEGSIAGTVFGALVLGSLSTGLVLVGAPGSWYTAIIGIILLVAAFLNDQLDKLGLRLRRGPMSR
ncbi:MAG TPA: ABC transporter permease [bacterium]|nr:ABC transporter permease [bacterium]